MWLAPIYGSPHASFRLKAEATCPHGLSRMKIRSHRSYLISTAACVWLAVNFEGVAQQPQTTVPQPPAGQVQAPPPQAPPQGRRDGGGGRKDDPVNADVDWTKQPPLLAKTPEEQLKTFILQPGLEIVNH